MVDLQVEHPLASSLRLGPMDQKAEPISPERAPGQETTLDARSLLSIVAPICSSISMGFAQGYSAVAISQIESERGFLDIDDQSWIGSLLSLGLMMGSLSGGILSDWISRRACIFFTTPIIMLGWLAIGLDNCEDLRWIFVGRFLSGFGTGCHVPLIPTYLHDISPRSLKSMMTSLCPLLVCLGILLAKISCIFLGWRLSAHLANAWTAIILVTWIFMDASVDNVPKTVISPVTPLVSKSGHHYWSLWQKNLLLVQRSPHIVQPMLICSVLFFFQCFSGAFSISYYTANVFQGFHLSETLRDIGVLFVGFGYMFGYCLSTLVLVNECQRRTLMVASLVLMALSLGVSCALDFSPWDSNLSHVLIALAMFAYSSTYGMGIGLVPYIYLGELFTSELKGFATGFVSAVQQTFIFVAIKTFPQMLDSLGTSGTYLLCAFVCLLGCVYVYFWVPETQGMNSEEIKAMFSEKQTHGVR